MPLRIGLDQGINLDGSKLWVGLPSFHGVTAGRPVDWQLAAAVPSVQLAGQEVPAIHSALSPSMPQQAASITAAASCRQSTAVGREIIWTLPKLILNGMALTAERRPQNVSRCLSASQMDSGVGRCEAHSFG